MVSGKQRRARRGDRLLLGLMVLVLVLLLPTSALGATVPKLLVRFPENIAKASGANRLGVPRAVATDPTTGHVYVGESFNNRISEFDAWGSFVKAFGWDVAPAGVNERQEIRLRATAGQFKVSFGVSTTADLPFDATAGEVEAALNSLASVSTGGGAVTVAGGPGGVAGTTPSVYTITFNTGPLAEANVAQLEVANGSTPLSGGSPSTTLEARTIANGTPAGTGLEACTIESGCKAGTEGGGSGQMTSPNGLAVNSSGDLYVLERGNARVQEFDSAGRFVLMFGGEVDKTTGGNVCTASSGDVCGAGVKGTGNGFFEPPTSFVGNYLALGSDGTVYVADRNRIQEFESNGAFKGQIKLSELHAEDSEFPESGSLGTLAFDPNSEALYFTSFLAFDRKIYKVSAVTGKAVGVLKIEAPVSGQIEGLATDPTGDLFATFDPGASGTNLLEPRVVEFGPSGEVKIGFEDEFARPAIPAHVNEAIELLAVGANGAGDLYVTENSPAAATSSVSGFGPAPLSYGPPPKAAPTIVEQFANSVGVTVASVRAKINPHFWADTRYFVEYGTQSCALGGCRSLPVPPGSILTSEIVNSPITTAGVVLPNLQPDTTYHYRFVAQGSGGGPVVGLSGKTGEEAEETFTTLPTALQAPSCPANEAFRTGPGAFLPDCRGYEMVSPVEKNGSDVSVPDSIAGDAAELNQTVPGGETLTYSAGRAFGEVESSPYVSQYVATRGASGWSTRGISPPREGPSLYGSPGLDSQYKAFTPDLCQGWVLQDADNPLAPGSVEGWPDLYRQNVCSGGYETLGPKKAPQGVAINNFRPEVEGLAADGSRSFFIAPGKLTNNASEANQLYEARQGQGQLRLVCILPGGAPYTGDCTAGTGGSGDADRSHWLSRAVSEDGSVVYWTAARLSPGNLYVRVNASVTHAVSTGSARFWTASATGSKALFAEGEELREYDLGTESSVGVVGGFKGVLGASTDLSRVYLVSTEAKDAGAVAGQPNLYLYQPQGGSPFHYIATLSSGDLGGLLSPVSSNPVLHVAQVTPDGGAVAFMSEGRPTGFNNTDANSGEADAEVYVYRVQTDRLTCVSCNATGARPSGRNIEKLVHTSLPVWAAAQIPAGENQVYTPRVLSDDGTRLFFESLESLVPRDTNGKQDVYEWQEAADEQACAVAGGELFLAKEGGCLALITTGESPQDSELVDSGASGRDVFFKTYSKLVPQDPGMLDIYDARIGGGFPPPPSPPEECEGEACQHPSPAPEEPTPSSATYEGPGNVRPTKRHRCSKGTHKVKVKGKVKCVKNRRHHRAKGGKK